MRIYRTPAARAAIRTWCERRLDRAGFRIRRQMLATPLGPTHVVQAGTSGPSVVFVPGTNFNAATSLTLLQHMAGRFRTSIVDVPGQPGLSAEDRPDHDRVAQYRGWLDSVLDQACPAPAIVVGHSLGAAITLCATPGRHIGGVALVAPGGLVPARMTVPVIRASVPWMLRPTPGRSARLLTLMSGTSGNPCPELAEWLTLVATGTRTSLLPGPLPGGLLEGWRSTPISLLAGREDCFFPPGPLGQRARRWLLDDVRTVDGCGHLLPYEAPASLADAVTALDAHARGGSAT